jgi:ankyrin repeat protein
MNRLQIRVPHFLTSHNYLSDIQLAIKYSELGNNFEIIKNIIKNGINLEEKDTYGNTILLYCLSSYDTKIKIINLLLDSGVNINCQDNNGNTALHLAIKYCSNLKIIELLLFKSIDTSIVNKNNLTVLQYCLRCNFINLDIKIIKLLLYYKSDKSNLLRQEIRFIDNICFNDEYFEENIAKFNKQNYINQKIFEIRINMEINKIFIKKYLKLEFTKIFYKPNNCYALLTELNFDKSNRDILLKGTRFYKLKLFYNIYNDNDFIKFKNTNPSLF